MALLQLTTIPLGTETASVGNYVAEIQKELEKAKVSFRLNDMGTVIEGNISELLAIIEKIYEIPFTKGAVRVVTQIVIDDRRDKKVGIGDKIDAVEKILQGNHGE
ncbi:MAG: MTH1187 family thiamine-binding protein [Thermodesulfobacteriota bacterium]